MPTVSRSAFSKGKGKREEGVNSPFTSFFFSKGGVERDALVLSIQKLQRNVGGRCPKFYMSPVRKRAVTVGLRTSETGERWDSPNESIQNRGGSGKISQIERRPRSKSYG
jgi:hypothetical protein